MTVSALDPAPSGLRSILFGGWQISGIFPTRVEQIVFKLTLATLAVDALLIAVSPARVDWFGYGKIYTIATFCLFLAHFYRRSGRSVEIAAALRGIALLVMFSAAMSAFNYLLMPTQRPAIDGFVFWLDGLVGYHWPDVIHFAAAYPGFSTFMKVVYMSSMPQLTLLVIVLGMTGRQAQLNRFVLAIAITSAIAVCFWGLFPSHGAKAYHLLPVAIEQAANPLVTTLYGRDLLWLAENGAPLISPQDMKGLIAFPSYHAVLACVAIWYARGLRYIFPVFLVVNLLVFPASLMHGGHHLFDLPAGVLVFAIGAWAAALVQERVDGEAA